MDWDFENLLFPDGKPEPDGQPNREPRKPPKKRPSGLGKKIKRRLSSAGERIKRTLAVNSDNALKWSAAFLCVALAFCAVARTVMRGISIYNDDRYIKYAYGDGIKKINMIVDRKENTFTCYWFDVDDIEFRFRVWEGVEH